MNHPTVIFDGVCNLCNGAVDFLLRHDRTGELRFGSFQEEAARSLLLQHGITEEPESIYLIEGGKAYSESDAVLRVSSHLKWPLNWGRAFIVTPRFIRDPIYRWIARNRYKWFGKRETCRLPTPEEKARFI